MALLVLLDSPEQADVPIGAAAISALALPRVTSVALGTVNQTAAVIFEGWAFNPASFGSDVRALGTRAERDRTRQPVLQLAVSVAPTHGGEHP